jgi:hypothetical protein
VQQAEGVLEPAALQRPQVGQRDHVVGGRAGLQLAGLAAQADLLEIVEGGYQVGGGPADRAALGCRP